MAKIPRSAKKEIQRKCPICNRAFKNKEYLVNHIDNVHKEQIPKDWSASRYENYLRTGKNHGTCIVCKKDTDWNESTWKYNRLCGDPKCKQSIYSNANKNLIDCGKYSGKLTKTESGKVHLLNDMTQQRKMIYNKKNSGTYYWSDDDAKKYKMMYASTVELKFLEMLDVFLNLDPSDVLSPSPNNYTYEYKGETHLYIPDVYIPSINLEIELKEPKDDQNMHPKIQAVDKEKEALKDDIMSKLSYVNYIKVNGVDYREFFEYFNYLKNNYDKGNSTNAILESIDNLDMNDFDIDDVLKEMMEEPVTESDDDLEKLADKVDAFLTTAGIIHKPFLDYNDQIKKYHKLIDRASSLKECTEIENSLKLFRDALTRNKDIPNGKGHREMAFESNKAIKKIDVLFDELEDKKIKIKKLHKDYYVSESYDKNAWFVTESQITAIKEEITYKPVFILLSFTGSTMAKIIKGYTHGHYSHSSLALDTDMKKMFSFDATGFAEESLLSKNFMHTADAEYALYMYMAPATEYLIIDALISNFNINKDRLTYSIKGLLNYIMGKETKDQDEWFCSEFVSYMLSQANPKLLKKHYSLYSPDDLTKTRKFIKISSGPTKTYDPDKIDRIVRKELTKRGFNDVKISNQ